MILLPTRYNDNTEVPSSVLGNILRRIFKAFGGYTADGYCNGSYRMADGSLAQDKCLKVWIILEPQRVDELKEHARHFAAELKQECIYFEVTSSEVEFLRPPERMGDEHE